MPNPVQDQQFTSEEVSTLKALSKVINQIQVTGTLDSTHQDSIYFTAAGLADHLGISIKTVY
jgi:hypothetical protein